MEYQTVAGILIYFLHDVAEVNNLGKKSKANKLDPHLDVYRKMAELYAEEIILSIASKAHHRED
jgi:hypothetical protein